VKQAKKWNLEPISVAKQIHSDWDGNWLVMRCSNQNTLPLVAAMFAIHVRAWTPLWLRKRRFPRSNNTRQVVLPCLPSFVFLAEADVTVALKACEEQGVPGFSLMNSYGVLVRIKDKDLESLREVADMNPRNQNPVAWPQIGKRQQVISGAFQGLTGMVMGRSRRHCLLDIEGFGSYLKIPPFLLSDIEA
jgi:hypothetical protein